jgi:hypothetical protein
VSTRPDRRFRGRDGASATAMTTFPPLARCLVKEKLGDRDVSTRTWNVREATLLSAHVAHRSRARPPPCADTPEAPHGGRSRGFADPVHTKRRFSATRGLYTSVGDRLRTDEGVHGSIQISRKRFRERHPIALRPAVPYRVTHCERKRHWFARGSHTGIRAVSQAVETSCFRWQARIDRARERPSRNFLQFYFEAVAQRVDVAYVCGLSDREYVAIA